MDVINGMKLTSSTCVLGIVKVEINPLGASFSWILNLLVEIV